MRRFVTSTALLSLALTGVALAQDGEAQAKRTLLRYNWVAGESIRYMLTSDLSSVTTGANIEGVLRSSQEQQAVFTLRVNQFNQERGWASVSYITESLRMTMTGGDGQKMTIDSSDPASLENVPGAAPLLALVGEPIDYIVEVTGEVLAVDGAPIREKVLAQLSGNDANPMMRSAALSTLGDHALKSTLSMILGLVPAREVEIGGKWGGRLSQPAPILGRVIYDLDYALEGIEELDDGRTMARIETTITASDDKEAIARAIGKENRAGLTNSSGTSRIEFDVEVGAVSSASSQIEFTFMLEMKGPDGEVDASESTVVSSVELRRLPQ
jgi:hypothetical protein